MLSIGRLARFLTRAGGRFQSTQIESRENNGLPEKADTNIPSPAETLLGYAETVNTLLVCFGGTSTGLAALLFSVIRKQLPCQLRHVIHNSHRSGTRLVAERVGFEPTWGGYAPNRFRVGAGMTTSVPLRYVPSSPANLLQSTLRERVGLR